MPLHWIALNAVRGLGPVRIKQLLERYGEPEAVFNQPPSKLVEQGIVSESIASQLGEPSLFRFAQEQLNWAERLKVSVITYNDSSYPSCLKEIFAPPPIIYVKGRIEVLQRHAMAVVGTRVPTVYGKKVTESICTELVERRLVIVSGLARGIDTCAHQSCISHKGETVAVLGCGLDRCYPSENRELSEKIVENGVLLSEFPLGTPPEAYNFPRRNRIISGLSSAVLVVEAGVKSGSLITAHYALQQGREVFAVPGPISSPLSMGTFNLIKNGAVPARSGHEIAQSLKVTTLSLENQTGCPSAGFSMELLQDSEKDVFEQLSTIPVRIDDLSTRTGIPVAALYPLLLNLELKGFIRQLSGQLYVTGV
jgi:DNA processing protein